MSSHPVRHLWQSATPKLIDALINPRQIHQVLSSGCCCANSALPLICPRTLDTPQQLNRQPNIARPPYFHLHRSHHYLDRCSLHRILPFYTPSFAILLGRAPRPPFLPRSLAPPPPCLRAGRKHSTGQRSETAAERSAAWKLYDRHHLSPQTKAFLLIRIESEKASRGESSRAYTMVRQVQPLRISKSNSTASSNGGNNTINTAAAADADSPNKMPSPRPLAEIGVGSQRRNSPSYNQATRVSAFPHLIISSPPQAA